MKVSNKDLNFEEESQIEKPFKLIIAPKSRRSNRFKTSTIIFSFPCLNSSFFVIASLIYCVTELIGIFNALEEICNKNPFFQSLNRNFQNPNMELG